MLLLAAEVYPCFRRRRENGGLDNSPLPGHSSGCVLRLSCSSIQPSFKPKRLPLPPPR